AIRELVGLAATRIVLATQCLGITRSPWSQFCEPGVLQGCAIFPPHDWSRGFSGDHSPHLHHAEQQRRCSGELDRAETNKICHQRRLESSAHGSESAAQNSAERSVC